MCMCMYVCVCMYVYVCMDGCISVWVLDRHVLDVCMCGAGFEAGKVSEEHGERWVSHNVSAGDLPAASAQAQQRGQRERGYSKGPEWVGRAVFASLHLGGSVMRTFLLFGRY